MKTTFDMTTNIGNVYFQNGSMKDLNLQQVDELGTLLLCHVGCMS